MSKVQFVLFHLTLSSFIHGSPGLIELPPVEPNLILETEGAIRSAIDDIFSLLNMNRVMEKPNLKRYGILHNYFTSLTLKDYNGLKEIAQHTRVDNKNIDNTTQSFITMINGILNDEKDENNTKFHRLISEDAANYLESYLKELNYFEKIVADGPRVDVNEEVAKILKNSQDTVKDVNITEPKYNTSDENNEDNIQDTNEFWRPNPLENRRIFNGRRTHIKTFPFMAVVQVFNVFQCAGSIIHGDLILTAASCLQLAYNNRFYRENPAFVSVRVGTNFHDGGGEQIPILEIFFHPEYNPSNLMNNLAVIRLVRFLKFSSSRVKKIAIDTAQATLPANSRGITLVGWGAKSPVNVIKNGWYNRLSYSILDIYGLQDCMDIYSREYITHKHFCAGFISRGGGACNHDVGGPGVAAGILRGVVSFGSPQCGTPDAPTVFTKVGYYADWIETIMEQNVPTGRVMSTLRPQPWTPPTLLHPRTTWAVNTPIFKTTLSTIIYLTVTDTPPVGRQSKKVNMQRFKDFLRTMFDSKEIDDYINQFIDEKGIGRQMKDKQFTTESTYPEEYVTKNVYLEPESNVKSETESKVLYTAIPENVTYYTDNIIDVKETEDEKVLEQDIVELINSPDMEHILIGPSFVSQPLSSPRHTKNKKNKKLGKIMGDKKIKKKHKKGEHLLKKTVPSTIELLYLSQEDEQANNGVNPIHAKGDKDDSEQQHVLAGIQDNDIEDFVRDNDEDTAEIAKKLEAITVLPDTPDALEIPEIPEIPEPYEAGSKININFRGKNKIDEIAESNFLSQNLIVDILNEVIKSESKTPN